MNSRRLVLLLAFVTLPSLVSLSPAYAGPGGRGMGGGGFGAGQGLGFGSSQGPAFAQRQSFNRQSPRGQGGRLERQNTGYAGFNGNNAGMMPAGYRPQSATLGATGTAMGATGTTMGATGTTMGATGTTMGATNGAMAASSGYVSGRTIGYLEMKDQQITNQEQWIQNQLASGSLNPQQQAFLQNRLQMLQSAQTNVTGTLSTDLSAKQAQLQSLLTSGNLNPTQQAAVQARLSQIQTQQSLLNPTSATSTAVTGSVLPVNTTSTTVPTTAATTTATTATTTPLTTASTVPVSIGTNTATAITPSANVYGSIHQLFRRDERLSAEEQWIQNQLASGNLNPQQQAFLQNRLTQLQSYQTSVNGALSTDLSNKQAQLQNLMSSGNLSTTQQQWVQGRLNQIQNQENAINSGTLFGTGATSGAAATTSN